MQTDLCNRCRSLRQVNGKFYPPDLDLFHPGSFVLISGYFFCRI